MHRDFGHDWELIEQANPRASRPFGFICCCGVGATTSFTNAREAIRAARAHEDRSARGARAA